jgi:hypothetical protein
MKCKNINPEESRKAIKESQKSLKPSKKDEVRLNHPESGERRNLHPLPGLLPAPPAFQKRATYFIADMDFQNDESIRSLKAFRTEAK